MKKDDHSSSLPPWVIIPFGGLLVLGLCYIKNGYLTP
ncbi:hypothetical protein SAMN05421730_101228 [Anaerobium acetethylicum]|uniref:Uncharacterized protein n=1 Tax=Anaerobium acetethylicum TaxID=1619234 RepID=A0A1D3TU99_9FIRM|nr:hypothetical protein SAMN05421730_101228 [Anaerobium acetethylicum]